MSIERQIGNSMLGKITRETAITRVGCNAVAMNQLCCPCGRILDQEHVYVVTVKTPIRRVVQGLCPDCWYGKMNNIKEATELTNTPILVEHWTEGIVFENGDVN